jgi:hypothetical protein
VQVRVEGKTQTLFDGEVLTDGHVIERPSSMGPHPCDGTSAEPPLPAGPTATSALDDASRVGGFDWDAEWFEFAGFGGDFFITRVGADANTGSQFWGFFNNGLPPDVGGCQFRSRTGDDLVWAFDAFSKTRVLKLVGGDAATVGVPHPVTVLDFAKNLVIPGATVAGVPSDARGVARVTFPTPGIYFLKAERSDSIRSKGLRVCADPAGVEPCTSSDRTAPIARLSVPSLASNTSRFPRVHLAWLGDDGAGSGVRRYTVRARRVDGRGGKWRTLVDGLPTTRIAFPATEGAAYEFQVQATDRARNTGPARTRRSVVPFDDLNGRVRLTGGWRVLRRQAAYGRTVSRSRGRGARAALRFRGTRVILIGRKLRNGGRARVTIDGRSRVVRLRGRGRFRGVLHRSGPFARGVHRLTVTALGGGPVELDGIGIVP